MNEASPFVMELTQLLNRHSVEGASGTPDFILATYLQDSLEAYNKAVSRRARWRDEPLNPGFTQIIPL